MYKQAKPYWCAPAAIQNALEALGKRIAQRTVALACGTTERGTSEYEVLEGLTDMGIPTEELRTNDRNQAKLDLTWALTCGRPVLLSTENWEHWITVITPPLGDRFGIVDPSEGVIRLVHWRTLEREWRAGSKVQTGPFDVTYYAIVVRGASNNER
jgi:ABC-type bacteriocin/lantibiotic exporter with double-glycine peptidase domain